MNNFLAEATFFPGDVFQMGFVQNPHCSVFSVLEKAPLLTSFHVFLFRHRREENAEGKGEEEQEEEEEAARQGAGAAQRLPSHRQIEPIKLDPDGGWGFVLFPQKCTTLLSAPACWCAALGRSASLLPSDIVKAAACVALGFML